MDDDRTFDHILQFTNVSVPRIANQRLHGFGGNCIDVLIHPAREILDEMPYEPRNVFRAFAQRGDVDWKKR